MSGYTKRMMDVAATWLAANPDADSPFLKVPGLHKNGDGRVLNRDKVNIDRYKRIAREVPATAPYVEQLLQQIKDVDEARAQLHESEEQLEEHLSRAPTPGHQKYDADLDHHADIGRWALTWARQGYNVFDLSPDFTAAILLTDARELDISDVRLPFSGMLLMISDGFAKGVEGTSYNKIHVSEVPRRDRSMLEAGDKIYDLVKDLPTAQASELLRDLRDTPSAPSLLDPVATRDETDTAIHIYASDGARVLETWIDRKDLTWDAFDDLPDTVEDDVDKQARHVLRRIVFGAIAYTNAVEGSMEERFAPAKKKPAAEAKEKAKHWTIGRTIKIDPKLVAAVRSGSREVAFRLKHRHIVRGHYRNQAHGPARSLRTKKWIAPFWKGPEEGAALVHTYKLDEAKSGAKDE
ncbi:MAG TPA: hypothetical protein VLE97_09030 [Gaiellaceae bacterium]|nr:hypothetical protein [Gaiellaceae bacterium]